MGCSAWCKTGPEKARRGHWWFGGQSGCQVRHVQGDAGTVQRRFGGILVVIQLLLYALKKLWNVDGEAL
ncbi:unnamed protein product [Bursaphelenchus xylophilus]|uniref:(pine wood nematode) hypothetical protein n=1 Tax=Bursaphelenchus xylophilus TaxID=6326 RepID=A0A7I8XLZ7_BURXY|nr:unnamed protein product [Bursaphelenchus xylophilus]CAG9121646.1 unnamed protein product [Bursaphelenchus xylophilus]